MALRNALLPVLLLTLPATSHPLPGQGEPAKTPVFPTEVSLVSLPVFVTDKSGRAMPGLGPEDFTLSEDGKPVKIVSFQYVDTTSDEEQDLIRQAPAARRRFLLLFDLSFTDPGGLHRAQDAARTFLRTKLAESDLAAVLTFDSNRGIRVVANFSEDRGLLGHAVETLGVPTLARISDPLSLTFDATDIQGGGRSSSSGGQDNSAVTDSFLQTLALRLKAADRNIYEQQVLGLMGSFEELGRALRNVEGRKQLLYFSAGFDSQTLIGMEGADARTAAESITQGRLWEVDSDARFGDVRVRELFGQMTRALSSADTVVHAVDVTGLGSDERLVATQVSRDITRSVRGRESLNFVAAETGGRFFRDTNDLGGVLAEIQDMTSRFYILGYQPESQKGPGQFHKLKLKVARKDAKVSHRAGYFERIPAVAQTTLQRKFEAAQLVMTGVGANDIRFSSLCLPFPDKGDRQTLGVVLQVPKDQLSWKAGSPLAVEVYGYAIAEDGSVTDHLAQLARMDPARADADGLAQGLSFYGTFRVPPGKYTIKLLVQDGESGQSGAQFMDVTVPPHDPRVGFLLPPVVMEEQAGWLGLDMNQRKDDRGENPFHVAGKPFLPRATFQVNGGSRERLVLIAWEPGRAQDPASGIEIQSSLMDSKGQSVPAGFMRIAKVNREAGGRRTYVLDYTPDKIASGDYTLRIGVGESGEARLESYSLLRFRDAARP
jgi:VWFA-related protein